MRRLKVIFPVFAGIFVYSVFSIFFGPKGVWCYVQLSEERDRLAAHLEDLYSVNIDLDSHVKNLTADPDTITVYAHELGFVAEEEKLIKLAGFSGGIDRKLSAGFPITVRRPEALPEWICKLFGLSGVAVSALILRIYGKEGRRGPSKKR